jgi:predicted nuclease of predicted toxin-antitoxin system
MPLALYMDHHVPRAITVGLRLRGVEVITAYEDGSSELEDIALLDRAIALGRVLFTRDDDLLAEATRRQRESIPFCGVVYAHQLRVSIGQCIADLDIIAKAGEPDDLMHRVQFLPL